MDDAADAPLQSRNDGDDEPPLAHGRRHVFVYKSFLLRTSQDGVQDARDAALGLRQFATDALQFGRCTVFHSSALIDDAVDAPNQFGEGDDAHREPL